MSPDSEAAARKELVRVARRLDEKGILTATDGNLSIRLGPDALLITPSGCCKGLLEEADLVRVDGTESRGSGRASSEIALHRAIYAARADAGAVVHAHPPYATAFAVAGLALGRPILSEAVLALGEVPVAPYATPTREELARSIGPFLGGRAVLLANHGAVVWDADIGRAGLLMETLEHVARIDWLSRALGGTELDEGQVTALRALGQSMR
ncbi:MAG TPA: class II aldolase/adducin family protein [Thermoanaerobaculia bacterium]|nr:class II aldolase/adducin family protein [Thermoanaerobaculia bacterium]